MLDSRFMNVGLSSPAVTERVCKLEDAGIITGYKAKIDPSKVGLPVMAIIRLSTPINPWPRPGDLIKELPEILEFYRVTGTDSYITKVIVTKVIVSSIVHLELIIDRLVPHGPLTTAIVLSAPISEEPIKQEARKPREETMPKKGGKQPGLLQKGKWRECQNGPSTWLATTKRDQKIARNHP